ncbi:ABC transporter ATP-binding protein [Candidatus Dependentiae bacterium]|nr:ABC transporter ATP-binding protein [Candidatus Dependentiae bacterium]MBU4387384.1 ABC transporter ATP-binding protein [Candidatus Dependentiae bacterium]MCG2755890.1 ABC transporter ATP-binding protein [Candidatus Dependentiae bacterium]
MRQIRLENVSKTFEGEEIISGLSLEIPTGKFFALLGPSGCGKTTILRLIAGLESVDSGKIYLGDQEITHQPIYKRRINTVFQQYALFPHLSVFENVAYSLRIRREKEIFVRDKVYDALKMVHLLGFDNKNINSLSGGQQQRVALARAIISQPEVLLLDEPLAALDQKLKEKLLIELIELQDKLKTTFVYVTHDQSEALTVADKMAIMNNDGHIEQIGTPKQIYEFPVSRFVANFVGNTNIIAGRLIETDNQQMVEVKGLGNIFVFAPSKKNWMISGCNLFLSIRPEKIYISKKEINGFSNHLIGRVDNIIYYGRSTQYSVMLKNGKKLMVFEQNEEHFPQEVIDYDDSVNLYFQKENIVLLQG